VVTAVCATTVCLSAACATAVLVQYCASSICTTLFHNGFQSVGKVSTNELCVSLLLTC
jgi:hypothetical protein